MRRTNRGARLPERKPPRNGRKERRARQGTSWFVGFRSAPGFCLAFCIALDTVCEARDDSTEGRESLWDWATHRWRRDLRMYGRGRLCAWSGTNAMTDIFTTGQVARICKVSPRTVNKWFDAGRLRGYRTT